MHFINKKKYNKKQATNRIILHKDKTTYYHNKNQSKTFTPIRLLIFSENTTQLYFDNSYLCQAFYQFIFQCSRKSKSFYCKTILYYIIRCEQKLPFAKLLSKKVDISKTRKTKNFKFSPLAKNQHKLKKIFSFNPVYFTTKKKKFV